MKNIRAARTLVSRQQLSLEESMPRRALRAAICLLLMIAGCGAETLSVRSYPPGAKVKVNGEFVGVTPVNMPIPRNELSNPFHYVVEMENYQPADGIVKSRVAAGRIVGAAFTAGILLIFRSPTYLPPVTVELQPVSVASPAAQAVPAASMEERLRKIESLHDKGLLSDQEYKRLRSDVLDELRSQP